jgi:hypothetical protein
MSNVDNPHGLRPLGWNLGGGPPLIQYFDKAVGYGTAIFMYDAVNRVADGTIDKSATPGTTNYSGVALNRGAASTLTTHAVIVSPDAVFEAQDNDDTDGFAAADMGLNVSLELNAGSATTGQSGHELDESTATTTDTLDMHMLALLAVPDNAYGAFSRIEVIFNKHRMNPSRVGV